jgi:hypothetical protein
MKIFQFNYYYNVYFAFEDLLKILNLIKIITELILIYLIKLIWSLFKAI